VPNESEKKGSNEEIAQEELFRERTKRYQQKNLIATNGAWVVGKMSATLARSTLKILSSSLQLHEKSLGRGLSLNKVLEASRSQIEHLTGSLGGYADTVRNASKNLIPNNVATGLKNVGDATTNSAKTFDTQGKNLSRTLTGFGTALEISWELIRSGLKSTNASTSELLLYTMLTGGNMKKFTKQITFLTRSMSLTQEQETKLSDTIQALSQNFQLTTEELVDSLNGLGEQMDVYKALDMGAEVTQAGLAIGAVVGKQGGEIGSKLLASLLSAEGIFDAQLLGVSQELVAAMTKGPKQSENMLQLLHMAALRGDRLFKEFTKSNANDFVVLNNLGKSSHNTLILATNFLKQMQKQADERQTSITNLITLAKQDTKKTDGFINSWSAFKRVIMGPLERLGTIYINKVLQWSVDNVNKLEAILVVLASLGALKAISAGIWALSSRIYGGKAAIGLGGVLMKLLPKKADWPLWLRDAATKAFSSQAARAGTKNMTSILGSIKNVLMKGFGWVKGPFKAIGLIIRTLAGVFGVVFLKIIAIAAIFYGIYRGLKWVWGKIYGKEDPIDPKKGTGKSGSLKFIPSVHREESQKQHMDRVLGKIDKRISGGGRAGGGGGTDVHQRKTRTEAKTAAGQRDVMNDSLQEGFNRLALAMNNNNFQNRRRPTDKSISVATDRYG